MKQILIHNLSTLTDACAVVRVGLYMIGEVKEATVNGICFKEESDKNRYIYHVLEDSWGEKENAETESYE